MRIKGGEKQRNAKREGNLFLGQKELELTKAGARLPRLIKKSSLTLQERGRARETGTKINSLLLGEASSDDPRRTRSWRTEKKERPYRYRGKRKE